jgi:hypothetical protein
MLAQARARTGRAPRRYVRSLVQTAEGIGQCRWVPGRHQRGLIVGHHVGNTSNSYGDDRDARAHRFEQYDRRAFGARSDREGIEAGEEPACCG